MKRCLNLVQILSAAGLVMSAILLYQHYHPDMDAGIIACGKGFVNPCISVGQSKYAVLLGVPVAALGLIFYMFITFLFLLADYTQGKYYAIACGLTLPLVSAGVAADFVLAALMVKLGAICNLCAATYFVNMALLISLIFMIKKFFSWGEIKEAIKSLALPEGPDRKAVLALMVLFIFFMAFSVISGSGILRLRAGINRPSEQAIARELASFYRKPVKDISFPGSSMTAGSNNPEIKIYVFTDFLCSACYKFYNTEKYILAKYGTRVQFIYYHYPLDSACNSYLDDVLYPGSCTASKSMHAAARAGFFEEYFFTHFSNYREIKEGYEDKTARLITDKAAEKFRLNNAKTILYNEIFDLPDYPREIADNIEFAEKLKIGGTPTVYIGGRELNGVPHRDILEAIIISELKACGN